MDKNSNTIESLLTNEELKQYKDNLYPFNLTILNNALNRKLKEDPNYEVWAPLYYYKHVTFMKNGNHPVLLNPNKVYISNQGRLCSLKENGPFIYSISKDKEGYAVTEITLNKQRERIIIHRAIACAFIPVKIAKHPKYLQINHINGNKSVNKLDNLEWCTAKQNNHHATDIGLTVIITGRYHPNTNPLKGTVTRGPLKGKAFVLFGTADILKYSLNPPSITRCCKIKGNLHKGCEWTYITQEEADGLTPPDEETIKYIRETNTNAKMRYIATNIETNETIELIGSKALKENRFLRNSVEKAILMDKPYKGFLFRKERY